MEDSLAEETVLSDELLQQLIAVGEVDILVGIPTCNNAKTIGQVVRAVQVGFVKYFPRDRTVLITPDGGSTDGTPDLVRNASVEDFRPLMAAQPLRTVHRITSPYHGISGRENAMRVIFAAAELLRAKACAVVGADLQSITPEWIESLIRPVYRENFDLVTPLYRRHKFDGLLITNVVYPLVRAVYGYRVKEPLGGEFGFSGKLAKKYLEENIGENPIARTGIDLWMTTEAMKEGSRICQSFLGPKVHASKESEPNLADLLRQVVGGLFGCMESHHDFWGPKTGSEPVPVFGFEYDLSLEPARVNVERMLHVFRNGVGELAGILEPILAAETFQEIQRIAKQGDAEFVFPDELWVKTVYEFASSHHRSVIHRDHLVQALTPIYLGRAAFFVRENMEADSHEVEKKIEGLCLEYERLKPYLIDRWEHKQ
jgi:hypothetical protein